MNWLFPPNNFSSIRRHILKINSAAAWVNFWSLGSVMQLTLVEELGGSRADGWSTSTLSGAAENSDVSESMERDLAPLGDEGRKWLKIDGWRRKP